MEDLREEEMKEEAVSETSENEVSKEVELSSEVDIEVSLDRDSGRLSLAGKYEGKMGGADIVLHTDAVKLIDKLTDLIPGEWDDRILDNLAQKLLSKKTGS